MANMLRVSTVNFRGLSEMNGARGGTRTPTPVKEPDPKSGASTNFATRAHKRLFQEDIFSLSEKNIN